MRRHSYVCKHAVQAAPRARCRRARVGSILLRLQQRIDVSALPACVAALAAVQCAALPADAREWLLDASSQRKLQARADLPPALCAVGDGKLLQALLGERGNA